MRWTLELPRPAAGCIVLLLGLSVMLLSVCGPMLCSHPCCPDHEPHCTVSADLANACPAPAQVKAPATQIRTEHLVAASALTLRVWFATSPHASSAFLSTQAEPPARSASIPLRI